FLAEPAVEGLNDVTNRLVQRMELVKGNARYA
ncbi:unnamed protein product, partial [marine sediment metagenome]